MSEASVIELLKRSLNQRLAFDKWVERGAV